MAWKSKTCRQLLLIVLCWAYPGWLLAVTPPLPARPAQYVVDLAGVLDTGTRDRLNAMLRDLEAKTTDQVEVLTLNSLEGEPIENFSHQTAVQWGLGQKGKDNGVLITVAVKDRKYRIEVGYGLEASLPDSLVGSIGRQYLVPNFRKGDFAAGIVGTVTAVVDKLTPGTSGEPAGGYHWETVPRKTTGIPPFRLIFVFIPLIITFILLVKILKGNKRGGGGSGFWFGGFGGGGSWGGGDSGGFGGGGGDFGGGGASGDW